jgi:hypothetical protein
MSVATRIYVVSCLARPRMNARESPRTSIAPEQPLLKRSDCLNVMSPSTAVDNSLVRAERESSSPGKIRTYNRLVTRHVIGETIKLRLQLRKLVELSSNEYDAETRGKWLPQVGFELTTLR